MYVCICTVCLPGARGDQKIVSDSLELESPDKGLSKVPLCDKCVQ